MTNKISTILNIVLLGAVIVLFALHFSTNKGETQQTQTISVKAPVSDSSYQILPIAYINLDSVMVKYEYYKELSEDITVKQSRAEGQLQSKMQVLESDYMELQEKAQKGLMTSREIMEAEQSMQARQQELMQLQQKLGNDLMQEEQRLQAILSDTVKHTINDFNKTAGYQVILNNAYNSSILYAENQMNITDTILSLLNKRYFAHKK